MRYFFILFILSTAISTNGQTPTINDGHGFYYLIPNKISYDIANFELDADQDLEWEKGAYYVKSGHQNVYLTFISRANKKKFKYSFSINKPAITGIFLGNKASGSSCRKEEFNKEDKLRLTFDVDTFLGTGWYTITGFTETIFSRSLGFISVESKNNSRSFPYIDQNKNQEPIFYQISKIRLKVHEEIALHESLNFDLGIDEVVDLMISESLYGWYPISNFLYSGIEDKFKSVKITGEEILNPIILDPSLKSDSIFILAQKLSNCNFEFYKNTNKELSSKVMVVDSLNATIFKYNHQMLVERTEVAGDKVFLTNYMGGNYNMQFYLHLTHKNYILAGRMIVEQDWINATKPLKNVSDTINKRLSQCKYENLVVDSITIMYKNKTIARIPVSYNKSNPCREMDCTEFTRQFSYYIPSGISIIDHKKLGKLNALLANKKR